ncbi:hypothetical protein EJ02DRAFT_460308 [Clathrospora elynae]|uniref:Uncharacterized protein n=1 Tax=Clathrospora elynae TaxID=706981 RepID=A0A6A5S600_9PLEO|nr:hypothetical protein EJ02DRAFT_460308 [Clathrospora elynae]
MSDSGSDNIPGWRAPPHRVPHDFPLSASTINEQTRQQIEQIEQMRRAASQEIAQFVAENGHRLRGLDAEQVADLATGRAFRFTHAERIAASAAMPHTRARINTIPQPPEPPERQEPKKLITTLVSMLPETTYNDAAKGTESTLTYVKIQRGLLKYLATHASDTLTARQAHIWTQAISSDRQPKAQDALRLCYYMRSQGFDTYADVKDGFVSLYIANQQTDLRGPQSDPLYWKQNFKTNEHSMASGGGARGARRNAFVAAPAADEAEGLLAHLIANGARPPPPPGFSPVVPRAGVGGPAGGGSGRDEAVENLANRCANAQVELEVLLSSEFADPTAVQAAIRRVDNLLERLAA